MNDKRMHSIEAFCAKHPSIATDGSFASGTVFGDWRLTAFIGRGGSGEVYCAEHTSLGTPAALKVLVREDDSAKARFEKEAKILSKLKSASFPRFFAYGEANGTRYLAMELLEPGELPRGDRAIVGFLLKVAEGVAELHEKGFVHRDVKPGNILYRGKNGGLPEPVICDFGLIKEVSPCNSHALNVGDVTQGGVGTPGFGAPEQMQRGEVSVLADIHALGVLTDCCFSENPSYLWRRIIERATTSIPCRRYPSARLFIRAVKRVLYLKYLALFSFVFLGLVFLFSLAILGDRSQEPVVCCQESRTEFPLVLELNGTTNRIAEPVKLQAGMEYRVIGPGVLDAEISGPTNTILRLKDCLVHNRTRQLYPENGLRYSLENGVYLNFPAIKESQLPLGFNKRLFLGVYDGAFNVVMFGGPETKEEFERLRNAPVIVGEGVQPMH